MTHLKFRGHQLTMFLYIELIAPKFRKQDNRIFWLQKFIFSIWIHVQACVGTVMLNTVAIFFIWPSLRLLAIHAKSYLKIYSLGVASCEKYQIFVSQTQEERWPVWISGPSMFQIPESLPRGLDILYLINRFHDHTALSQKEGVERETNN